MAAEKHDCAGHVFGQYRDYPCSRNGTYHEDGEWWCASHAPSKVAERKAKQREGWEARRADSDSKAAAARALSRRADCSVTVHYDHRAGPTDSVVIRGVELARILKEAGR